MGQINFAIGLAIKVQAGGFGAPETFATAGALTLADGIVLGDAGSGIGESGIDFELSRVERALAAVTGSFTQQFPAFVRRDASKLSIAIPAKGHCANVSATPVDADFDPTGAGPRYPGLDALLRSAGLLGAAWGSGVGWSYQPATAAPCTVKVWIGSGSDAVLCIFQDCVAKLTMDETPGSTGVWTFDLSGTILSITPAITLPTFAYGAVATTSAPVVQSVGHSFGLAAALRGFSAMKITLDNQIQDVPDSNQPGGSSKRQTGRTVTLEATLYAESTGEGYEEAQLSSSSPTTDDVTFQVGSATAASQPQLSYKVNFNNPDVLKVAPDQLGPSVAKKITLSATATVANGEFELVLL